MELLRYIRHRLIQVIIIFFVILTVLFVIFRLAPGDPIERMIGPDMDEEAVAVLKEQLGLDQPLWVQYTYYVKNFAAGNFGLDREYDIFSHRDLPSHASGPKLKGES